MAETGATPLAGPGPEEIFQQGVDDGEFKIQQCGDCGKHVFYPRAICPHCGSGALSFKLASGKGEVYATSVVRQRPEDGPDYNIAIVELAEGPRMMTRVVDVAPDEVRIGQSVDAFVGEVDGAKVVLFRPAGGSR